MKYTILIIIVIFISDKLTSAQNFQNEKYKTENQEKYVKEIREKYNIISSNLGKYKKTEKTFICDYNWGNVEIYKDNENIMCFRSEDGGEHGSIKREYYFWDNSLFFVYTVWNFWEPVNYNEETGQSETKQTFEENRYCFYKQQAFKCLLKETVGSPEEVEEVKKTLKNKEISCFTEEIMESLNLFTNCVDSIDFKNCICK